MTHLRKLSFCAVLLLLSALACWPIQSTSVPSPQVVTPTPTATQPTEPAGLFRHVASLAGLLPDTSGNVQVRALADGSAWIIMSRAVMRWAGREWEFVLSESENMLAAVDDGGRLWVLRQDADGIAAWQDGQWTTYATESGWTEPSASGTSWWAPAPWSVSSGAAGTLWFPMGRDVRAFDGNSWSLYTLDDMGFQLPDWDEIDIVHLLAMRAGGAEVWVGECYYSGPGPMGGQGVRWFDGQTWHGVDAPVNPACISAMIVDNAGNVWFGAANVIWRYEPATQAWTPFYLPEELLSGYNFARSLQLIIDRAGDVWVIMQMCGGASCSGPAQLYRIRAGEWSLILTEQDFSMSLKQLVLDGSGLGWSFWEGAVYRLEPGSVEPVASIEARGVDVSPDGKVWVVAGYEDNASLWIMEPSGAAWLTGCCANENR